jgi:predicted patatin/cPLA2 family phospholipase
MSFQAQKALQLKTRFQAQKALQLNMSFQAQKALKLNMSFQAQKSFTNQTKFIKFKLAFNVMDIFNCMKIL